MLCVDYIGCESNPCENGGTCQNEDVSYNCTCPSGFGGTHCDGKFFVTHLYLHGTIIYSDTIQSFRD